MSKRRGGRVGWWSRRGGRAPVFLLVTAAGIAACAPDYLDLGHDLGTQGVSGVPGVCTPGEQRSCYDGPEATRGKGSCKPGEQTCTPDGSGFGVCEGEKLPAIEDCATPEDDDCDGLAPSCTGEVLWTRHFGAALDQAATAVGCKPTGEVFVAGYFSSEVDFGGGVLKPAGFGAPNIADVFVASYDPSGSHLWSKRFGDSFPQQARALAVGGGRLLLAGEMVSSIDLGGGTLPSAGGVDVFVASLETATGAHVWSKSFGGSGDDVAYAVAVDAPGDVVMVGAMAGPVDFGGGPLAHSGGRDVFVVKLDGGTGAHVWSKSFGSGADDIAYAVAVDSAGDVALAGVSGGPIDFGAGPGVSAGGTDLFVTKLDGATGELQWSKSFGSPGDDVAAGIAVAPDGELVLAGTLGGPLDLGGGSLVFAGGTDVLVAKLAGTTGAHLWSRSFGAAGADAAAGVVVDGSGNVVLVGLFEQTIQFGPKSLTSIGEADAFVAKLDGDGKPLWSQRRGDEQAQEATAVCAASGADLRVTLNFRGAVDTGDENISSSGDLDALLLKLAP